MGTKITRAFRMGIVGADLACNNEAYANQARVLTMTMNVTVFTCSSNFFPLVKQEGKYIIVSIWFLVKKIPILAFFNGCILYLFLKVFEWRQDRILLCAGVESMFWKYLNLEKCVPLISTINNEKDAQRFALTIAPKLKKIIVQSNRVKDYLVHLGVTADKLFFNYPIVDLNKFMFHEPLEASQFRLLFASSPNLEMPGENNFVAKGVPLLLEAFKEFIQVEVAHLYILWRGKHNRELNDKLRTLNLEKNVTVIDQSVDTSEWYPNVHVTVIPFTSTWRSPQIPLSALESIVSGRPVVTTDVLEIAEIIGKYGCGCVCHPTKDSLVSAFKQCKEKYIDYQKNCMKLVELLVQENTSIRMVIGQDTAP